MMITEDELILEEKRRYKKEWRDKNKDWLRQYYKEYRAKNKERLAAADRKYWLKKAKEQKETEV